MFSCNVIQAVVNISSDPFGLRLTSCHRALRLSRLKSLTEKQAYVPSSPRLATGIERYNLIARRRLGGVS